MTHFEKEFFKKVDLTQDQILSYLANAKRDFQIAKKDEFIEVKFQYTYQCLIKLGIALLSKVGKVKMRSVPGHHIKILSKMSEILNDPDIEHIGNAMRSKRNLDLYEGGTIISEKDVRAYMEFVEGICNKVTNLINE